MKFPQSFVNTFAKNIVWERDKEVLENNTKTIQIEKTRRKTLEIDLPVFPREKKL